MVTKSILSLPIQFLKREEIFKKIQDQFIQKNTFFHIVSLNPEILVIAKQNSSFRKILSESTIQLCDGVGVLFAARFLGIPCDMRISGVDLMEDILQSCDDRSLCVVLIGGKDDLANKLANCYSKRFPKSTFIGIEGYKDLNKPTQKEETAVMTMISEVKPDIIFAAFGAPAQERWFYYHRAQFKGIVCMGVGGAFDYLGGTVSRAPVILRTFGLEWLYRLFRQPWRLRRQLRLIQFVYLVLLQKLTQESSL